MEFIKLNGLLEKESNFFSVEIKNGKNKALLVRNYGLHIVERN
jgi:hypothetical protein